MKIQRDQRHQRSRKGGKRPERLIKEDMKTKIERNISALTCHFDDVLSPLLNAD